MEVYSENDKKILLQHEHDKPWSVLSIIQSNSGSNPDENTLDFEFGDGDTNDYEELVKASVKNEQVKMVGLDEDDEDDVSEDDI
jgi:hypothetical protein